MTIAPAHRASLAGSLRLATVATLLLVSCDQTAIEPKTPTTDAILQSAVEDGDVPGVVAMAATADEVIYQGAFGEAAPGNDMTLDATFQIASLSKPVTSVAAMQLVEEGQIELDEPVSTYLPDFSPQVLEGFEDGNPVLRDPSPPVTVRQILTHTAGFGYEFWNPLLQRASAEGMMPSVFAEGDGFLAAPLVFDPGTRWHYGINTDWVGRVVETVRGASLDEVFREHIFEPLGMNDTHFNPPAGTELVAVYQREDGRLVAQEPQPRAVATFFSGGGGLVSTASDYTKFLRMLLNGGSLGDARVLEPETVALMAENHIGDLEAGAMTTVSPAVTNDFDFFPNSTDRFGLGFLLNTEAVSGGRSAGSLAWAGVYNTYFWVDRDRGVAGVLMTQILPFFDAPTIDLLERYEQSVYGSLTSED